MGSTIERLIKIERRVKNQSNNQNDFQTENKFNKIFGIQEKNLEGSMPTCLRRRLSFHFGRDKTSPSSMNLGKKIIKKTKKT